jgi:oligopeptide/dipeptide ABC transporter ATP-binding protein
MSADNLLEVRNLSTSFQLRDTVVPVVQGVDFDVRHGEVLGIIGESGSGKTVTCMSILRLLPAHAKVRAQHIRFNGEDIQERSDDEFEALRGRRLAMIFQDPVGSFNPVKTIGWHFRHASLRVAKERPELFATRDAWRREAIAVLERVGIPHGGQILRSYPHQLSGGMLQRALVALVLQLRPALIVADEPTTNLDNIVEHQIVELFRGLKDERHSSFIFITHDMAVAARLCDRIAVMYAGQIVEIGTAAEILTQPRHPYTQGLVRTSTELVRRVERLQEIPGELPHWRSMPEGCRFRPRCGFARPGCERDQPLRLNADGREVRCLLYEDVR